jgi:hypothetical protein
MKNQEKHSLLSQLINFVLKLLKEQTPTIEEFRIQLKKAIFRLLVLILSILLCLMAAGIILGIYILGFFLNVLGKVFLFGAVADYTHDRNQDKHYEEHGRYY